MTTSLRFLSARADDLAAIEAMVGSAYAHYVPRIGRRPAPMTEDYAALAARGELFVLSEEGRSVGTVTLTVKGEALEINNLAVDPQAQGRGHGRRLMAEAEGEARSRGLSALSLYTNERMHENLAFYRRLGFTEIGRRTDQGFNRVYFRKDLV